MNKQSKAYKIFYCASSFIGYCAYDIIDGGHYVPWPS